MTSPVTTRIELSVKAICHALLLTIASISAYAGAENFPSRPITLIVPYSPGLASDSGLRALAEAASKHLGQRVDVRNMPGASGTLGAMTLYKDAAPDGYTISQIAEGTFRLPDLLKDNINPRAEFTWIIGVTAFAYGVAVNAASPWKTWGDFVAAARAKPGAITYATTSVGGTHNRVMEALATKESIKWTHVPFREGGQATDALLAGQVDAFVSSTGWGDLIAAGKIRMLVSWNATRPTLWPEVPTLKELGYDLVVDGPYGLAGPRNMDPKIVQILHDAFRKAMADPNYLETIAKLGQEPWYRSSEDYADYAAKSFEEQRRALALSRTGR